MSKGPRLHKIVSDNDPAEAKQAIRVRKVHWIARFFDFAKTYRSWIAFSLALGILGGCLAAFVFNTWVTTVSIRNVEGYFDLAMLTNIKHELPFALAPELDKVSDEKLALSLKPFIKNTQWPEKNIQPVFAILKNDVQKAMLGLKPADMAMPSVLFVEMTFKNTDKDQLHKVSQWMSEAIIKVAFREKYLSWLNGQRKSNEDALLKLQGGISEQIVSRLNNEKQLEKTKEIATLNSSNKAETSPLPVPLVGSLINHDDLIKFLPINSQVDGLLLQQHQIEESFDQTKFRINLANHLIKKSIDATRIALEGSLAPPFYENLIKKEYWDDLIVSGDPNDNTIVWKRDFIKAVMENIYLTNTVFMNQLDYQLKNYQIQKPKRRFGRIMAVFLGGCIGLLIPLFAFLVMNRDAFLGEEGDGEEGIATSAT